MNKIFCFEPGDMDCIDAGAAWRNQNPTRYPINSMTIPQPVTLTTNFQSESTAYAGSKLCL
ncbi:MAG: hypothetical protein KDK34_21335 [Leptospiraceae bacterium]|nr:hypothetical protein [Leptospiraceae bacterium]MCB1322816.1 hypothetical protein [Leptospiraceae bacterium]